MNNLLKKLKAFTILYVEDDRGIRENFEEILKHYFKEVFVAKNSKEAYEKYLLEKPDLLMTDIKMENESGIDLIKKIRENRFFSFPWSKHTLSPFQPLFYPPHHRKR